MRLCACWCWWLLAVVPIGAQTRPVAPVLISPFNGSTGVGLDTKLTWSAAAGATKYQVYLSSASKVDIGETTETSYSPPNLKSSTTYTWFVYAVSDAGVNASNNWTFTTATPGTSSGAAYYPVTPCRVVDTRPGQATTGTFGPPSMTAASTRSFVLPQGRCNLPATAQAYSLNITAIPKGSTLGYLSIWPTGQAQPTVSTLNSTDGSIVANAAIVPAGNSGAISVYVTDAADVVMDVNGYFDAASASGLSFYAATPCRVADTRNATGAFGGPRMGAGETRTFLVAQSGCPVAALAKAYSMNATVVPAQALGYLSLWATGQSQPVVSTLNSPKARVLANAALVPAGTNSGINAYVTDPTELVFDINGWFAGAGSTGELTFRPVTPCRVLDTRNANGASGGPIFEAGTSRSIPIPSSACGIPSTARAYSVNVTVVPESRLDYLTIWPTGGVQPYVSTLNSFDGRIVANAALVPADTNGAVSVYVTHRTHVIVDVNGYFAP